MTITKDDILKLAESWTEPKEVQTQKGPRMLREALGWKADGAFWDFWKANKEALKAAGCGLGKDLSGRFWELKIWEELPETVKAERAESVELSKAASANIDLPRPAGLNYMPFQIAGIQYALNRPHVLIADEMGLGKTIQAIGILNADPSVKKVLVICPKSLKINWLREMQKWLVLPLTVGTANGSWPETDIVIMNYDSLGKYCQQTHEIEWDVLILDEAHLIKNAKTQRSGFIKGRAGNADKKIEALEPIKAKRHIRLTGTPICSRPVELWNLINDLHPRWASFRQFTRRYCGASYGRYGADFSGATHLDELQIGLRETVMVRRLKSEVLTELPKKIRQIVEVEAETKAQKNAVKSELDHEEAAAKLLAELRAAVELSKAESEDLYKEAVARLTDAIQVGFTEMAKLRYETAIAKLPIVIEHVKIALEDSDSKLIIAAHHHDVIDGLLDGLKQFNPVSLTGRENELERAAAVDRFQTDPTCRVFIGGIKAAGVGITLTASSHVVFGELDWTPGNMSQMEDRAHRIGQTETVLVQHIVLSDSLDARMVIKLVEKQEIIDSALDKDHPARTEPIALPVPEKEVAATANVTRQQVEKEAEALTPEQVAAVHTCLKILAGMDTDFAREINGIGYNKADGGIGHSLAERASLTPKQAVLGAKLANKYRRQLSAELLSTISGKAG